MKQRGLVCGLAQGLADGVAKGVVGTEGVATAAMTERLEQTSFDDSVGSWVIESSTWDIPGDSFAYNFTCSATLGMYQDFDEIPSGTTVRLEYNVIDNNASDAGLRVAVYNGAAFVQFLRTVFSANLGPDAISVVLTGAINRIRLLGYPVGGAAGLVVNYVSLKA